MVDKEFLHIFLDEAVETLERWESACLKLEADPSAEVLNDLFRSAHNIKGSSRSIGLDDFGALVHSAEDVITQMKNGALAPSPKVITALLDCQRVLLDWAQSLRADPAAVLDTSEIARNLTQFLANPDVNPIAENLGFGFFEEEAPKELPPKSDRPLISASPTPADTTKSTASAKADETIRVSLRKLDSVIRLIGELSIQHSIVQNSKDSGLITDPSTIEAISLAHKVVQDLQSEAMALRMQPLEGLFQRMERVCRDVARQLQKPVNVVLRGSEVELDKTVIEKIKDPLVHILRNAVDHGVEAGEARQSAGKPEVATVTIEATQTASNVVIRIADDGAGLHEDKILKKAREKQLINTNQPLSAHEVHQLIFLPGFSTAEKVTDVSGRGVGMDVVKRSVDELGGEIGIFSEQGKGTEFLISLPSTLSILDAVVVGLGGLLYAVPVQDVDEVVDMSSADIQTTTQRGRVINLRGRILPVERLSNYLTSTSNNRTQSPGVALITKYLNTTVAFEVERVAGQQSIVVRQLEGKLAQVPGFAGGTILSNGEPSMIIHLPQIVKNYLSAIQ